MAGEEAAWADYEAKHAEFRKAAEASGSHLFVVESAGAPPDQPPPLRLPCFAQISNGKPPVWFMTIRTVSTFFAWTSRFTPFAVDS